MNPSYNNTPLMQDIDRLVDGELSPGERQNLVKRLDNEPDAWRRCALAFLEDQAWRESLKPAANKQAENHLPGSQPPWVPRGSVLRTRAIGQWREHLTIAATVLLAFTLGWSVKGVRTAAPVVANANARAEAKAVPSVPTPQPQILATSAAAETPPHSDPESEDLRALERAGYEWQRRNRMIALDTRDGRQVAVPIREYSVQYVGDRTY